MSGSYQRINYSLRPAKQAERRMLCESFQRLKEFAEVSTYRYVGMGSPYFVDFRLIHKQLGISDMVCIEINEADKERFEFNKPFACIDIKWGSTTAVLPQLPQGVRAIIWLDYDGGICRDVLSDIRYLAATVPPGSVLVFSLNVDTYGRPGTDDGEDAENNAESTNRKSAIEQLKSEIGEEKVPLEYGEKHLAGWNKSASIRQIVINEIKLGIDDSNGIRPAPQHRQFQQLYYFEYADGARMMTVGGVVYDSGQGGILKKCSFEELGFIRTAKEPFRIVMPRLTMKEIRFLDSCLPNTGAMPIKLPSVKQREIDAYTKIYRWFPLFAETEM